ncbi:MAG: DUF5060 domain-containing protein, partial [Bdellovibrionales bacterium]|nr:DUF5060 domain-containing protein [Bdellovibrionales bacterium]
RPVWYPVTISFPGPVASELDAAPNPFLDYRLSVTFSGPNGQTYVVPGFFDGDGSGGGSGNVWKVRFAPDQQGQWTYLASFRSGSNVAVNLSPGAGTAGWFDGATGTFQVTSLNSSAPGFYKWGMLEYIGEHYLKFRNGPYFIKGGVDSPENFLGYRGFDNTVDQGCASTAGLVGGLHQYSSHRDDWNSGDPLFTSATTGEDSKGIIGALNYLSLKGVNSIYFLPMNLGGDGCDTYPFVGAGNNTFDKTHYDISKLNQWNLVFEHATGRGLLLHVVLNETESGNETWLDGGSLGNERKLFYRELIARFGHNLAIKWNFSEENDFSPTTVTQFAQYVKDLDPYDHSRAFHTHPLSAGSNGAYGDYDEVVSNNVFTEASIQHWPNDVGTHIEYWRTRSAALGQPWVVPSDEQAPAGEGLTDSNIDDRRKAALYDAFFSGGHIEWYFGYHNLPLGGDLRTEDFRTREPMWDYMRYARTFIEQNLPFWEMDPRDDLVVGETQSGNYGGAEVFAKPGQVYAVYYPVASNTGALNLSGVSGSFTLRFFNPRTGQFEGTPRPLNGGGLATIGAPPAEPQEDWVALIN